MEFQVANLTNFNIYWFYFYTMFKLFVILYVIKMYARNNIFLSKRNSLEKWLESHLFVGVNFIIIQKVSLEMSIHNDIDISQ